MSATRKRTARRPCERRAPRRGDRRGNGRSGMCTAAGRGWLPRGYLREKPRPIGAHEHTARADRKSTRLNSSHLVISYGGFCLKKKNRDDFYLTGRSAAGAS